MKYKKNDQKYTKKQLEIARELYNGEIKYTDYEVGRVLDFLKQNNIYDNTLIIVTNDHGEDVEDHGPFLRHNTLYAEVIR